MADKRKNFARDTDMKFQIDDRIFFFTDRWSGAPELRHETVVDVVPGGYITARQRRVRDEDAYGSISDALTAMEIHYARVLEGLRKRYVEGRPCI